MSKKVKIIILVIVGVLILSVAGILLLINSEGYKEKLIESELRKMAEEFYGYYYDDNNQNKKASEYLEQFKDTGLSITLGDLKIFLENRTQKKYDSKKLEKCDVAKTITTMYPQSPYGKKDLKIKFDISCK
jgi:hypothetical protein